MSLAGTKIVESKYIFSEIPRFQNRIELRNFSKEEFIERHGSGTLRKNFRIGFDINLQYKEERAAYEFGWGFRILNHTRVTFGIPISEGDCHAITEAGWHIERYLNLNIFEEDIFELKYIQIEESDGTKIEGIGIVCRQTSAQWIGANSLLFAMVAVFNPIKKDWENAENPF